MEIFNKNITYCNDNYSDENIDYHDIMLLWRKVIIQAVYDMQLKPTDRRKRSIKNKTMRWLRLNNKDFLYVCHMAGINPKILISHLDSLIKGTIDFTGFNRRTKNPSWLTDLTDIYGR
jgi:hypothetical protein